MTAGRGAFPLPGFAGEGARGRGAVSSGSSHAKEPAPLDCGGAGSWFCSQDARRSAGGLRGGVEFLDGLLGEGMVAQGQNQIERQSNMLRANQEGGDNLVH